MRILGRVRGALSSLAAGLLFFASCMGVLYMPQQSAEGVRQGVEYSLNVLLPSLFPFMFLSSFAAESGISRRAGKLLAPFSRYVLYLPADASVAVLLSLVGGYPVGAVSTAALLKKGRITQEQAARMMLFCVNPGPAFLICVVGQNLYGSETAGVILFLAQTAASLLIGAALSIPARRVGSSRSEAPNIVKNRPLAEAFVLSSHSASVSAVSMCSLVILFSVFEKLTECALSVERTSAWGVVIGALLEVTDGTNRLSEIRAPLFLTAAVVGWGGLCVHLQVFSAAASVRIKKLSFVLSRLLCALLSSGITVLLLRAYDAQLPAAAVTKAAPTGLSSSYFGSLALLLSCVMLILTVGREKLGCTEITLRRPV